MNPELADTLIALVEGVEPPPGSGLVVTQVELDVPLEVTSGWERGEIVFFGRPPHSRWQAGVLPPVHWGHLRVELVEALTPTRSALPAFIPSPGRGRGERGHPSQQPEKAPQPGTAMDEGAGDGA